MRQEKSLLKEQLAQRDWLIAQLLHQDEIGLYVAGKRQWLHVSATE